MQIIIKPSYCDITESVGEANTLYIARDTGFAYVWETPNYYHIAKELLFVEALPEPALARPEYLYIDVIQNVFYRFDGQHYIPLSYRPDNLSITSTEDRTLSAVQLAEQTSGQGYTSILDTGNGLTLSSRVPTNKQQSYVHPNSNSLLRTLQLGTENIDTAIGTHLTFYRSNESNLTKIYYQRGASRDSVPLAGDELITFKNLSETGTFIDAPIDGKAYGRRDAGWVEVSEVYQHIGQTPLIDWLLALANHTIDDFPADKIIVFYTEYPPSKDTVFDPNPELEYPAYASVTFRYADSTPARPHRYILGYNVTKSDFTFSAWDVWWDQTSPDNPWVYTLVETIWNAENGWLKPQIKLPSDITVLEKIDPDVLIEYWAITGNVLGTMETETVQSLYNRYLELRQALIGANTNMALLRDMICKTLGISIPCFGGNGSYGNGGVWGTIRGEINRQADLMQLLHKKADRLPYWTSYKFTVGEVPGLVKFSGVPLTIGTFVSFKDGTYLRTIAIENVITVQLGVDSVWQVLYTNGEWLFPVTISSVVLTVSAQPDFQVWQSTIRLGMGLANDHKEAQQLSVDNPDTVIYFPNDVDYSLLPTPPTEDNRYTLKVTVIDGVPNYEWIEIAEIIVEPSVWVDDFTEAPDLGTLALAFSNKQRIYKDYGVWFRSGMQFLLSEHPELEHVRYVNVTCKDDGAIIALGENVISPMTSNITPSPQVASASSEFLYNGDLNAAYRAFGSGWWVSATTTGWVQIDLGVEKSITAYAIEPSTATSPENAGKRPKTWTLQGSHNGTNWDVLHTVNNYSAWLETGFSTWELPQIYTYRYYRLNITQASGDLAGVNSLQLISPDIRETRCIVKISPIMDLLNGASVYMFVGYSVLDITRFESSPPTGTLGYGSVDLEADYVTDYGLWLRSGEPISGIYAIRLTDAITIIDTYYFTTLVEHNLDGDPAYFFLGNNLASVVTEVDIYDSENVPEIGTLFMTINDALFIKTEYGLWLLHNTEIVPEEFPDLVNSDYVSDTKIDLVINTINNKTGYVFAGWSALDINRFANAPPLGTLGYGYDISDEYYETEYGTWIKTGSVISLSDYPLLEYADFLDEVGTDALIQPMTSNTAPSPQQASASGVDGSNNAYRAFDNNVTQTYWKCNNTISGSGQPQWLRIDLGSSRKAIHYSLAENTASGSSPDGYPKSWKLQGSNDNSNWTDLHQVTNFTNWTANTVQDWEITTPNNYRYYRILITETSHFYYGYPTIAEFQLYGQNDVILAAVPDSPQGIAAYRFVGHSVSDIHYYTSAPPLGTLGYGSGITEDYYETEYGIWAKAGLPISLDEYPALAGSPCIDIEGSPVIAQMSSNELPPPQQASASNVSGSNNAFYAFDRNISTTYWKSGVNISASGQPQWLKIDLGESKNIIGYSLAENAASGSVSDGYPTSWILQGSPDDINWTDIHQMSNFTDWAVNAPQKWSVNSPNNYRYYRIYITQTIHVMYGYPTIAEFQLYDNNGTALVMMPESPQGYPAYWFIGFPESPNENEGEE